MRVIPVDIYPRGVVAASSPNVPIPQPVEAPIEGSTPAGKNKPFNTVGASWWFIHDWLMMVHDLSNG